MRYNGRTYDDEEQVMQDPIAEVAMWTKEQPVIEFNPRRHNSTYTVRAKRLEIRTGAGFECKGTGNYFHLGEKVLVRRCVTIKGAMWGATDHGWIPMGFISNGK